MEKQTHTTKDLLKHTFEMMVKLKEKKISVEDAKAQANLIKQANNVFKYELDRAIAMEKYEKIEIRNIES